MVRNIDKSVKMLPLRTVNRRVTNFVKFKSTASFKDVAIPGVTLPEYIFTECEKYGSLTAIVSIITKVEPLIFLHSRFLLQKCGLTGRKYTYSEIIADSVKLSKSLRRNLKLNERDVVALFLPNLPEYPIAILGILHAGLLVTTINHSYTSGKIQHL